MKTETKGKGLFRKLLSDSAWSIAGLVLMNLTAQFAVYPVWNRELGNELYGRILYLIAGINIVAISMGVACNYARMKASAEGKTENRGYSRILLITSAALVPFAVLVALFSGTAEFSFAETGLLAVLAVAVMWRYYADVEYRLKLNYRAFFIYYLAISIGYGIGIGLFLWTKLWPLALLPGELAGIILAYTRGTVLRPDDPAEARQETAPVVRMVMTLFVTEVISNLIANGDRVLLNLLVNGTAVTVYYQASLMGKTMALITTPLNSVLIGYLSRYKSGLTRKIMNRVALISLIVVPAATGICVLGSHVLIRLLYPQNYELVRPYFLMANAAQAAFFVSGVAATMLLRFCKIRYQLYINLVYAGVFIAMCIPGLLLWKLEGLCIGMMAAGMIKLFYILFLGYRSAGKEEKTPQPHDVVVE